MKHLAVLSMHTSPLVQPGSGDGGGMNVYVRELALALALAGAQSTVFTRRVDNSPTVVNVEPGFRVVHIDAGSTSLTKEELPGVVGLFTDSVAKKLRADSTFDGLLANYWLSGLVGHQLKHQMNLPLITTFHTLARIKADTGDSEPQKRIDAETEVIGCSDVILASSFEEARQLVDHYGAEELRIEVVPPGVDHMRFSPGSQLKARQNLGLGSDPMLMFVGRLQPLKGVDVAITALKSLNRSDVQLAVVGGPSGLDGLAEQKRIKHLVNSLNLQGQVIFVPPQPHDQLENWYRAADVVVMPSRSESFGLVALEAAACGIPVVAAAVGGLRTLVDHGKTGYLIDSRDPEIYAQRISSILDNPLGASEMSVAATRRSWSYTWSATAARLRRVCDDLASRTLVDCS